MYRFRHGRTINVSLAAALAAIVLGGLGWHGNPAIRLQESLASLAAHDWEALEYRQLYMPAKSRYAAARSLFAGALKLHDRDFVSAQRDFRNAAADPAFRPLAWLLAGETLFAQNRLREAEQNFSYAIQLQPNLVEAHRWLAIVYYDLGLMRESVVQLNRVAELDPADPRPHRVMAVIHMDLGSDAIAVEEFEESLRRDPRQSDRQDILIELAQAQLALRRYDAALKTLSACETNAEVLALLADACYALGDTAKAKELAQASHRTDPGQRLALIVLGKAALDERRHDDAIEMLKDGAELAPADYQMQYTLLVALRAAGRTSEAEQQSAKVEALRALRDKFDALLEQAVSDPYNAEIRYQLGVVAGQLEMPRIAESWLKAAVALDANHILARTEWAKYRAAGFNAAASLRGS